MRRRTLAVWGGAVWGGVVLGLIGLLLAAGAARADSRVALVIGNSAYRNVAPLTNPHNDAAKVAAALRQVGFSSVDVKYDLGSSELRAALQTFAAAAESADVAVIYYAGHGMEVGGTNYLIPVDATLARETDLNFEAIPLGMVLDTVAGARRLKIVVLDACRNNPFAGHMKGSGTRAIGRGLARVEPENANTLVAYAAKDGTTADDGARGNSPFATAFSQEITTPGLEVRLLFGKVRDDVYRATNQKQEPFVYGSLGGEAFYFVAPPGSTATVVVTPTPTPAPGVDPKEIELTFWKSVADSADQASLQSYLDKYPNGDFAALARAKLAALKQKALTASAPPPPAHPAAPAVDAKAMELALWNAVADSGDPVQLQSYLDQYPNGTFANAARAKIAALRRPSGASSQVAMVAPAVAPSQRPPGRSRRDPDAKAAAVAYKLQGKVQTVVQRAETAAQKGRDAAAGDSHPDAGSSNGTTWQYRGGSRVLGFGSHDGVTTWADGARYEGDWRDGRRVGYGVCVFADGSKYQGEWRDDRRHGLGVETLPDGTRIQGEWRDDRLAGGGRFDAQGRLIEAGAFDFVPAQVGVRR